jgi:hypothetical protein
MACSILQTNNFLRVAERQKGEWLEADGTGQLHSVNGFLQKCWFVIRNIFTCGGLRTRTAKALSEASKQFFDYICLNCPSPLREGSPILTQYRDFIQKMSRSVEKMTARMCDQKIAQRIKDLNSCPEAAEAAWAMDRGIAPRALNAGVNGSYTLLDRNNQPCGIFKPQEQEAGLAANPKGVAMGPFLDRVKIKAGTSHQREAAVYLLDHEHFAGVPTTTITEFPHSAFEEVGDERPMRGSFQKFVPNCREAWDHYQILPSFLSTANGHLIPAHEIHKIAILDIRTLNSDRHLKNFLVDGEWHVHPIDHGYTLPGNASNLRFNWMHFNQAKEPFSQAELDYIERLDPQADVELLKEKVPGISSDALGRVEVAGMLLKLAARRGLTAYQIGKLMSGGHADALNAFFNMFVPMPLDQPSYFERGIYKNIPWRDKEGFLNDEITKFLATNPG